MIQRVLGVQVISGTNDIERIRSAGGVAHPQNAGVHTASHSPAPNPLAVPNPGVGVSSFGGVLKVLNALACVIIQWPCMCVGARHAVSTCQAIKRSPWFATVPPAQ